MLHALNCPELSDRARKVVAFGCKVVCINESKSSCVSPIGYVVLQEV